LRNFLLSPLLPLALLLPLAAAPGLAAAKTYKCVTDGKTIYSQEPCGANAQQVQTTKALSGVATPTAVPPAGATSIHAAPRSDAASAPAPPPPPTPSVTERSADCAARMRAYQESQACFAPYRINANVMDPEAFKHCTAVPEPTDCMAGGAQ
jgi:hypothetical protein